MDSSTEQLVPRESISNSVSYLQSTRTQFVLGRSLEIRGSLYRLQCRARSRLAQLPVRIRACRRVANKSHHASSRPVAFHLRSSFSGQSCKRKERLELPRHCPRSRWRSIWDHVDDIYHALYFWLLHYVPDRSRRSTWSRVRADLLEYKRVVPRQAIYNYSYRICIHPASLYPKRWYQQGEQLKNGLRYRISTPRIVARFSQLHFRRFRDRNSVRRSNRRSSSSPISSSRMAVFYFLFHVRSSKSFFRLPMSRQLGAHLCEYGWSIAKIVDSRFELRPWWILNLFSCWNGADMLLFRLHFGWHFRLSHIWPWRQSGYP